MLRFLCAGILLNLVMAPDSHSHSHQESSPFPITVVSYNVRYDNSADGVDAWPNRKDRVAEVLASDFSADIAGLQEVLFHQLQDLEERLVDYEWVGAGRDDGHRKGELAPIFYRRALFELLATNTFWLSRDPRMPGSKSWDAAITRIATWVKLRDRRNNREFYVLNTHFDHRGAAARVESARMIAKRVSDFPGNLPVIITGDFNVDERSEAYAIITETAGLRDARYVSESGHKGPTTSSNDWEQLGKPGSRIDYIFVNPLVTVSTHRISTVKHGDRFPSDHLPVVVELGLKEARQPH